MIQIDKVIRIPMNSELYYDYIKTVEMTDSSEYWYDLDGIIENELVRKFIINYSDEIIPLLELNQANYVAIYED